MDEKLPGIERPHLQALPQIGDRMTFLYLEHCQLNREDSAILIRDTRGTVAVPAAGISALLWRGECMKCVFRGRTFLS